MTSQHYSCLIQEIPVLQEEGKIYIKTCSLTDKVRGASDAKRVTLCKLNLHKVIWRPSISMMIINGIVLKAFNLHKQ